jgi:hypothetical protein
VHKLADTFNTYTHKKNKTTQSTITTIASALEENASCASASASASASSSSSSNSSNADTPQEFEESDYSSDEEEGTVTTLTTVTVDTKNDSLAHINIPILYSNGSDTLGNITNLLEFQNIDCQDDSAAESHVHRPTGSMVIHNSADSVTIPTFPYDGKLDLIMDEDMNLHSQTGSMIIHQHVDTIGTRTGRTSKIFQFPNVAQLDILIDQDMVITDDESDLSEMDDPTLSLNGKERKKHARQTTIEFQENLSLNMVGASALMDDIVNDMASND